MKKIDSFTGKYSLSKTLRFRLIPVGKTLENFKNKKLLDEDMTRAENYEKVKLYMDRKHKAFIDRILQAVKLENLSEYIELYYIKNKTDKQKKDIDVFENAFRKQIAAAFKNDEERKLLFGEKMIKEVLPSFLEDEEEIKIVNTFNRFTTYFTGFYENRKNMYSADSKSSSIAYRCIDENLPRFLDNAETFRKIAISLPKENFIELTEKLSLADGFIEREFLPESFNFVLSQSGIDEYNLLLGGKTLTENGEKVKGLNEYINLFNQQHNKEEKLPHFKPLRKQILSDRQSESFIPEAFSSDNELITSIKIFFEGESSDSGYRKTIENTKRLFYNLESYGLSEIFISAGADLSGFSARAAKSWSAVRDAWIKKYDRVHSDKDKKRKKYKENRDKKYKTIKSFSLSEIQAYIRNTEFDGELPYADFDIVLFIKREISELVETSMQYYENAKQLLNTPYASEKNLLKDSNSIELIKNLLDSLKEIELYTKAFKGSGKEDEKDESFYGEYTLLSDELIVLDSLYNKVRNYLTRKPFSSDKLKLNFRNAQLLDGWDISKEKDYKTILLRKEGSYYLGIVDEEENYEKLMIDLPRPNIGDQVFEKMNYKLLPNPYQMLPKVFFSNKNKEYYSPSDEILRIRDTGSFKNGKESTTFNHGDLMKFIDFYKESIKKNNDWNIFGFKFRPTVEYKNINEFYKDVSDQGYSVSFSPVSADFIRELVEDGRLYLFRLYNKDFSENSKGIPNLHTMYFRALFDEHNLSDVVYKLNGKAEMFYRDGKLCLKDTTIHTANQSIKNKNPLQKKATSTFAYDIIKDRRYTEPQFFLHLPITMNFKAEERDSLNCDVRKALRLSEKNYIIGIDRGERNLLYISVIDQDGRIVEQESMNILSVVKDDVVYETDYHDLLDRREKERDAARKSWKSIKNIKELKEGYLSGVVNRICNLVVKYDAIIAMEDLNMGFKRSRSKVEKQVYQKFEKMLIDKMNYLVDKKADINSPGGLMKAYQLTEKFTSFKNIKFQNGFIFYVPAWLTSKIDPTTGFVSLFRTHGLSEDMCREFVSAFDLITYNNAENQFEFVVNYDKFIGSEVSPKKLWTVCTNGERVETKRSKAINNNWESKEIILTDEFVKLFKEYGIDYSDGKDIKAQCLKIEKGGFLKEVVRLFALTVQMRNSIPNTDVDYLISPVRGTDGKFFDSRKGIESLPKDADANGAYNIARKALWIINRFKESSDDELLTVKIGMTQRQWLEFAQSNG